MSATPSKLLKEGQDAFFLDPPDLVSANRCFEAVVDLAPRWIEGHHWLAICKERLRLHAEAVKSYRAAIDCDSKDPRPRIALGRLLSELGHHEQAIVELRRGLKLAPRYGEPDARLFLAEAYTKAGDIRSAKEQWVRVAGMKGSHPSCDGPMKAARQKLKEHE